MTLRQELATLLNCHMPPFYMGTSRFRAAIQRIYRIILVEQVPLNE